MGRGATKREAGGKSSFIPRKRGRTEKVLAMLKRGEGGGTTRFDVLLIWGTYVLAILKGIALKVFTHLKGGGEKVFRMSPGGHTMIRTHTFPIL